MPSWLKLLLVIAGFILFTGLMAAAQMGSWRVFWVAVRQFSTLLLALAGLGLLAAASLFIWPPVP